uniref:Uncharacterized protein n=1 Tax=Leersia perrieri TaxID=77586 RepID=A0A0D9XYL9_9ORYZ
MSFAAWAGSGGLLGPPVAGLLVGNAPLQSADAASWVDPAAAAAEVDVRHGGGGFFGDPRVDLYLADASTPPQRLRDLLAAAWDFDALTALKLVCNLRGVRDTGKGDREGFYTAALWMHQNHPRTLACNLHAFADFGYIKDFPELLYRLIHGADARKVNKAKSEARAAAKEEAQLSGHKRARDDDAFQPEPDDQPATPTPTAMDVDAAGRRLSKKALKAARLATLALNIYRQDAAYRFLFDSIVDFFVRNLTSDLRCLQDGHLFSIGLTAKWCPSLDSSFDQTTLLCEGIARGFFPRDSHPEYADMKEEHYLFRVRCRLRREFLVPLRKALQLPEIFMTNNQWSTLPYERVATVAMRVYQHLFQKHDEERFKRFLTDLQAKKAKISKLKAKAAAPFPFHMIACVSKESKVSPEGRKDKVEEWRSFVTTLRAKGSLHNCLAVCDTSKGALGIGEGGKLLKICVALGLLISELSSEPWKDTVYAFSTTCAPYSIEEGSYEDKVQVLRNMACDGNFRLTEVFRWILSRLKVMDIKPSDMVKTIFVFTDKYFEEASVRPYELIKLEDYDPVLHAVRPWWVEYRALCEKFKELGFEDAVPQVVVWNLKGPRSAALTSTKDGIMTLSGYSDELMTLFLDNNGVVEPEHEMLAAIAGKEYQKLQIVD